MYWKKISDISVETPTSNTPFTTLYPHQLHYLIKNIQ